MSRARGRTALDVCADCGASDPSWASINRGILLCMECCSVHRSLGRHISHVKSLHQGTWPPSLLNMINALTLQNVNSIWEHSLLDSAASKHLRRKPQPKDSLHSVKFDFIKTKHLKLGYVFRPRRDDVPCNAVELSRQLHSSVRSTNLDTSLRLLVQGADPNYFNQEKGTSCLHVACRTGNASQAELLIAWGADPNVKDASGSTPSALARLGGHLELADRITELVYEVTDRLSYHLCNKKPDHKNGQHYISLDKIEPHEMTDVAKAARGKLQLLPNHLFEELIMDIYDEIDRRECEAVWITSAMGLERFGVAFLPVNPALSAPRNQGRQKLARLSAAEMAALLRDILMDASRRQHIATLKPNSISIPQKGNVNVSYLKQMTHLSDDEPLYDSVASDDDYAALVTPFPKEELVSPKFGENTFKSSEASISINDTVFSNSNTNNSFINDRQSNHSFLQNIQEIEQLRRQINLKDSTIEELKSELQLLKTAMESLKVENVLLKNNAEKRNSITSTNSPPTRDVSSPQICSTKDTAEKENNLKYYNNDSFEIRSLSKTNQRPSSMFESRERTKYDWNITKQQLKSLDSGDNTINEVTSSKEMTTDAVTLPNSNDVHKHAELVTKRLQEICAAVHSPSPNGSLFEIKAKMINVVVERLISIFPQKCDENTASLISQLSSSCKNLDIACSRWSNFDSDVMDPSSLVGNIRLAAYELAKSTKMLVSNFPLESDESQ